MPKFIKALLDYFCPMLQYRVEHFSLSLSQSHQQGLHFLLTSLLPYVLISNKTKPQDHLIPNDSICLSASNKTEGAMNWLHMLKSDQSTLTSRIPKHFFRDRSGPNHLIRRKINRNQEDMKRRNKPLLQGVVSKR